MTTFDTYEDAEKYYYAHHQCDSDDSEKEEARITRWIEEEGIIILND